jgi:TRAP-type C4-dicarboxylate transport system permease small subunit
MVNAGLTSLCFAALLFLGFFLFTVIPNAMNSWETGWSDYTPEQKWNMSFWYLVSLTGGVALIILFFYSRRRKYHIEG